MPIFQVCSKKRKFKKFFLKFFSEFRLVCDAKCNRMLQKTNFGIIIFSKSSKAANTKSGLGVITGGKLLMGAFFTLQSVIARRRSRRGEVTLPGHYEEARRADEVTQRVITRSMKCDEVIPVPSASEGI
ncbi:hypothetical protein TH606_09395 [Thermodesulfatator autotrophicus]|uniref:Uncharacterized protein n=1 Tax=Thermodesulfatator autotrophicus TaxID=1795632 RepID=A0A177E6C3_9BACT|nr:hypothetical protein TH606_09395 [Thermodesulfatator autotrophicus]